MTEVDGGGVHATLHAGKSMHDRGRARVLMGNHELNAVCYHTPGRKEKWLLHHGDKNKAMHQGTLDDFPDHKDPAGERHRVWMPWLKRLPFFLDLSGLRAVHACWHPDHLALLAGDTGGRRLPPRRERRATHPSRTRGQPGTLRRIRRGC